VKLPNIFLIGAAKSGTSALAKGVSAHPRVFLPESKEPFYFAYPGKKPQWSGPGDNNEFVVEDFAAYRNLYANASEEQISLDASAGYLYSQCAADNVYAFDKSAKIVAILRQPAERAFSAYMHVRKRSTKEVADFSKALDLEQVRIAAGYEHLWHYRAMGLYADQLERWFAKFPREQIRIFLYDDFVVDPHAVYRQFFAFLGVADDFSVDTSAKSNVSGVPKSERLHKFLWSRNPFKRSLARLTPSALRSAAWRSNLYRPQMTQDIKEELTDFFTPDIKRVERIIGRDLSHWLR